VAAGKLDASKSAAKSAAPAKQAPVKTTAVHKPAHGKNAAASGAGSAAPKAPVVPAATVKSSSVQRPAAVSTQKNDTSKSSQQPRNPMASSTASKITPQPKAAVKPADIKVAVAKAPVAKPAAPVKAPNVKVATVPVAQLAAARAPESRPASTRAMPAAVGAATAQRISAPAAPAPVAAAPAAAAVVTPKDIALKAQQAAAATPKKPINARHGFKINELVVYPAHGVGRIVGIEEQEIAGMALELFVITFEKDKMTLRVPTGRSQSVMRKLAEDGVVKRAMETLKGKARIKRTMWSRRAQEFEQKINSGDLVSIAEVVRDLFRAETQPEQSYSERQLYEAALDRMAREIAAVEKIDERGAVQRVTEVLSKSAKSRRAESEAAAPAGDIKAA
jgi:CarD family transcriptional regulator